MAYFAAGPITAAQLEAVVTRTKRKLGDQTVNNSTTLVNDADLSIPVAASTGYTLEGRILYQSGTTPDFKFGWTFPSATIMSYSVLGIAAGGATFIVFDLAQTDVGAFEGTGANRGLLLSGTVVTSTTAGTLQLQWAQNTTNASDTIVRANSFITLQQIVDF